MSKASFEILNIALRSNDAGKFIILRNQQPMDGEYPTYASACHAIADRAQSLLEQLSNLGTAK